MQRPSASRSVLKARVWKKTADRAPPAALAAPAAQPALGAPPRDLNSRGGVAERTSLERSPAEGSESGQVKPRVRRSR